MAAKKQQPKEVPVYLFMGFLESGKTTFIQGTLEDPRFDSGERTLLVVCEEGEEEYNTTRFASRNVKIAVIGEEEEFTLEKMTSLCSMYSIERVLIEFNGMWLSDKFFEAMPDGWMLNQVMFFADANTILAYNQNMRQLAYDKMQMADTVVFNRLDPRKTDKMELHKMVRAVSRRPEIIYEDIRGEVEYDEIEDPLPFDLEAPVVKIEDRDFALFYRDISENMQNYRGKVVHFKGLVLTDSRIPKGTFVSGRHIMTCCEADIKYCGIVCVGDGSLPLKTRDWVELEGIVKLEKHRMYRSLGPVIYLDSVAKCDPPEQELATFF